MKNVLIVDRDPAFLFWLGEVLAGANYRPWPACRVADAMSYFGGTHVVPLDLLIVDPTLRAASHLIAHFRRHRADLKVLAVGGRNRPLRGFNVWTKQRWLRAVERMFAVHQHAA